MRRLLFLGLLFLHSGCSDPAAPQVAPARTSIWDSDSALAQAPSQDERLLSGLIGSKHDFSQAGQQPADLCLSCHSPHIAELSAPLLDRRPTATQPVRAFLATFAELDSSSLLCLSCHDGVTASDVYSGGHAASLTHQLGGSQLGTRSLSSHPIGIEYPVAEATYRSMSQVLSEGRIKLPGGRVQCISCHDPHNTGRHPGMLVMSNSGSRLCLSCHRL